jgi:hypothetical protein
MAIGRLAFITKVLVPYTKTLITLLFRTGFIDN